jgi:hypothetical protein
VIVAVEPAQTDAGKVNDETGMLLTFTVWVFTIEVQPPAETCRVIFLDPADDQETESGPAEEDVAGVAPTPKSQA